MPARFLNVDPEIWSASKLDALAKEMGDRVFVLHCGPAPRRQLLAVEVTLARWRNNPDRMIVGLCGILESLSPVSQRLWKQARLVFDVGYEGDLSDPVAELSLRPETLARISKLGANLTMTCYGCPTPIALRQPSATTVKQRKRPESK